MVHNEARGMQCQFTYENGIAFYMMNEEADEDDDGGHDRVGQRLPKARRAHGAHRAFAGIYTERTCLAPPASPW